MAYMDDMAAERERTRAKMLEGKTPLLGEDTSRALHALGVSLGVVPAGSPPGQFAQLLASLSGPVKGVRVDDYKSPQAALPAAGARMASTGGGGYSGGGGGDGLSGLSAMMANAKDSALQKLLEEKRKAEHGTGTQTPAGSGGSGGTGGTGGGAQLPHMVTRGKFKGVDPGFMKLAENYSRYYDAQNGPYKVHFTSGYRQGDPREHGKGNAIDMQLIDRKTGKALPNYQSNDPAVVKAYQDFANGFKQYADANAPDIGRKLRWGGYFSGGKGKYGALDLMHFDQAGDRIPMGGGGWETGFNSTHSKTWGIPAGGGTAGRPAMAADPDYNSGGMRTAAAGSTALSPQLLEHARHWEGLKLKAYDDGRQWSIGYGTRANSPNETITKAEAETRLRDELTRAQSEVNRILPANAPEGVRNALTSLTFNAGPGWITEKGGRLAAAVRSGDYGAAATVIREYNHDSKGNVVKGLTDRRNDESTMISTAAAGQPAATTPPATTATTQTTPPATQQPPAQQPPAQQPPVTQPPAQQPPAQQPPAQQPPAQQPPVTQPPAAKGPTGVQKANAFLDMKAIDLIRRDSPENDTFVTRQYVGDKTVRQLMGDSMASGKLKEGLPLAAKKYGFTPQDFDAAMHGKRADAGPAQTSDQLLAQAQGEMQPGLEPEKTQYAQADTGTATDAGPQPPAAGGTEAAEALRTALGKPDAGKDRPPRELEPEATVATPEQAARDKAWQDKWASAPAWQDGKPPPAGKNDDPNRPVTPEELEQIKALNEIRDAPLTELFPGAPARPQEFFSKPKWQQTEAKRPVWTGFPESAPATAQYSPYPDAHPSENIEDRRGEVGGARRALGIRAGIDRMPPGVEPWVDPDPGKNNPLARAAGIDDVDPRAEAIRAAFIKLEAQKLAHEKELAEGKNLPTLDPASQPAVQDKEGNISTVRTIGINDDGKEVNIPTVPKEGGRIMSNEEAIQRYLKTGNHLGKFDTPEAAARAAELLHWQEAQQISQHPKGVQTLTPEMINALENVFKGEKDESRLPQGPPSPQSLPVLPSQVAPMPQAPPGGGGGGLSLAPPGLNTGPVQPPGAPPSQGAPIAMAGLMPLPPVQDTALTPPSTSLSPIPWDVVSDWGGGGFGGFGAFG